MDMIFSDRVREGLMNLLELTCQPSKMGSLTEQTEVAHWMIMTNILFEDIEHLDFIPMMINLSDELKCNLIKRFRWAIRYFNDVPDVVKIGALKRNGGAIKYIDNPTDEMVFAAEMYKESLRVLHCNITKLNLLVNIHCFDDDEEQIERDVPVRWPLWDKFNPTDKIRLALMRRNGYEIRFIENPTEEMMLAAVKNEGDALRYIRNPTEKVKLTAVKNNGFAIIHIQNPSEEMKHAAVESDGCSIEYINEPSEEMKLAAVRQNGLALEYIKNPTEEMKLAAVENYGPSIQYINAPSEEMKLAAVRQDGMALKYINNPTEEMKLIAVKNSGWSIQYIKEPSEEMKLAAVKRYGRALAFIRNPTEEMMLAAVRKDPSSFEFIKKPSQNCMETFLDALRRMTFRERINACAGIEGGLVVYARNAGQHPLFIVEMIRLFTGCKFSSQEIIAAAEKTRFVT